MGLVEKYEYLIGKIKLHQEEFKLEISQLVVKDLTKDEQEYLSLLMDWIKSSNVRISLAEYEIKDLKRG